MGVGVVAQKAALDRTLTVIRMVTRAIFLPSMIPPGRSQCIGIFCDCVVEIENYRLFMQREDTSKLTTKKSAAAEIDQAAGARADAFWPQVAPVFF